MDVEKHMSKKRRTLYIKKFMHRVYSIKEDKNMCVFFSQGKCCRAGNKNQSKLCPHIKKFQGCEDYFVSAVERSTSRFKFTSEEGKESLGPDPSPRRSL